VTEGIAAMVRTRETIAPDPATGPVYADLAADYVRLYEALRASRPQH
jgi:hypothetical protein